MYHYHKVISRTVPVYGLSKLKLAGEDPSLPANSNICLCKCGSLPRLELSTFLLLSISLEYRQYHPPFASHPFLQSPVSHRSERHSKHLSFFVFTLPHSDSTYIADRSFSHSPHRIRSPTSEAQYHFRY